MKDTYMQKKEDIVRNWYVIDAEGQNLGRVATKVAHVLRGKNKPTFTPHIDCGDYVIVINASKVNLTGNKLDDKIYYNHSGYTGGLRERTARTMRLRNQRKLSNLLLKECFQKEDLDVKCIKNYLYMKDLNIHIWLNNQLR